MKYLSTLIYISMILISSNLYAQHEGHGGAPSGKNCGSNYMLPGNTARLGSHTFMLLGQDGPHHVLAAHRSGTPPHNYQFILRFRLDDDEMARYSEAWAHSKTLPAFTTIEYDQNKKKLSRTFFCLNDLPQIFGKAQKKGDAFEKLFPIKGALMMNAQHEGLFKILPNVVPGPGFSLERSDVEIVFYRYLPTYLPQKELRKSIEKDPAKIVPLFSDAPRSAREKRPARHASIFANAQRDTKRCRKNYSAPKTPVFENPHTFMLLPSPKRNTTLAVHIYGEAPHNFQSVYELTLSAKDAETLAPLYKQKPYLVSQKFCLDDYKSVKAKHFSGPLMSGSRAPYVFDTKLAALQPLKVTKVVNRQLGSLMNPLDVAREVLPKDSAEVPVPGFVALSLVDDTIKVDARYAGENNFLGRKVTGYEGNRCFLKQEAANALSTVQSALKAKGYGLLVLDCYRPQRAVIDFMAWTKTENAKMKARFYPKEKKSNLVERGYIASKSSHSKGNTLDVTLVRLDGNRDAVEDSDCGTGYFEEGRVEMGTPYDCFSDQAATASKRVSVKARGHRLLLKEAMAAAGFGNYSKEWWHFKYKAGAPGGAYDFVVR